MCIQQVIAIPRVLHPGNMHTKDAMNWMCGENWLAVKDSLTNHPSSQGWASGVHFYFVFVLVYLVLSGCMSRDRGGVSSFLSFLVCAIHSNFHATCIQVLQYKFNESICVLPLTRHIESDQRCGVAVNVGSECLIRQHQLLRILSCPKAEQELTEMIIFINNCPGSPLIMW